MMTFDEVREYALTLSFCTEDMPFGDEHLVFRVGGKIFLIAFLQRDCYISVKCDPERAVMMRELHPEVEPAYHMNKKHWNGIHCSGHLSRTIIEQEIKHSYDLVFGKLPAKLRKELQTQK